MSIEDTNDPVRRDAEAIARDAAELGQSRGKEMDDAQERAGIAAKKAELEKEIATEDARDAVAAADQAAQRAKETAMEADIADKDQDAQHRTGAGAGGAVPGPTPSPQPPRPRVG